MSLLEILKTVFSVGISKSLALSGGIILQYVLATKLSVSDVGLFVSTITFLTAASVFVRYGVDTVILKNGGIYHFAGRRDDFTALIVAVRGYIIKRSIVITVPVAAVILLGIKLDLFAGVANYILLSTVAIMPFYSLLMPISNIQRAKDQTIRAPLWEQGGVSLIVSIILLPLWIYVNPAIQHALLLYYAVTLVLTLHVFKGKSPVRKVNINDYDGTSDYGISQISVFMAQWGVVLLLSVFGSNQDVAYLSTALRITTIVGFVLIIFNGVLGPRFASLYKSGDMEKFKKLAKKTTFVMSIVAAPPTALLIIYPEAVLVFFGDEYKEASLLIIILAVSQYYNVLSGSVLLALNMANAQKDARKIVVLTGLLSVSMAGPAVYLGGTLYAGILIALVSVIANTLAQLQVRRRLGFTLLPL